VLIIVQRIAGDSDISHVIFCQRGRLRDHELGTLDVLLTGKHCSLCTALSDAITKTWHSENFNRPSDADKTCSVSEHYWPCGMLYTGRPASEERSSPRISSDIPDKYSCRLRRSFARMDRRECAFCVSQRRWRLFRLIDMRIIACRSLLFVLELAKPQKKIPQACRTTEPATKPELPQNFMLINIQNHGIASPPNNCQYGVLPVRELHGCPCHTCQRAVPKEDLLHCSFPVLSEK
jgi:hypothetical protein